MSEHTEMPWVVRQYKQTEMIRIAGPTKSNGKRDIIAVFPLMQKVETNKANADFIVQACNSHDDLLAALLLCIPIMEAHTEASHLIEGFARKENEDDRVLAKIKATIKMVNTNNQHENIRKENDNG